MEKILGFFLSAVFVCLLRAEALAAQESSVSEVFKRPKVEYKAEGLVDPFESKEKKEYSPEAKKTGAPQRPLPELTVQGVIWGGPISQVIINDKVVNLNEDVPGTEARITGIGKEGITVLFDGLEYILSAKSADYKMGKKITNTDFSKKGGPDER